MEKIIKVKPFKRKSKLGKIYEIDLDNLTERFNQMIEWEKTNIKNRIKSDNIEYEWDKEPDMTTSYGLAKYFIKNFYITYYGNPSQNGGHFNFTKGDRGKDIVKQFKTVINDTLSCDKLNREWGYGRNQLGYMFVPEDIETSNKFVDYLINYNVVDLDEYILDNGDYGGKKGENLQTYGKAILLYLIRSSNFKKAEEFLKFADDNFKKQVAYSIRDFYRNNDDVDSSFVKRLSEYQRKGWVEELGQRIEMFLYLSKLYPTAFLDEFSSDGYYLRNYETFQYKDFNTTLNIINDKGEITIRDGWKDELNKFFTVEEVIPTGLEIRVNGTTKNLNLDSEEGELIISYKDYDGNRSDKENYLNPQVYGILVECGGETHSFGTVMWRHYEYKNAVGELCDELIKLGYLPVINELDVSSWDESIIKYKKHQNIIDFVDKFKKEKKKGVSRIFNFNWVLIEDSGRGNFNIEVSFRGHYTSGSYVHDYEANYEYQPYLNSILGTNVKWLGYDSSDHSYKYQFTSKI